MKIKVDTSQKSAEKIAAGWKLSDAQWVTTTYRAAIYKVQGPNGPLALKLYKEVGASGEGLAIRFLRNLAPGIGPEIYRVNSLRTAVAVDWFDGPMLTALIKDGDETQAIHYLTQIAKMLTKTDFAYSFLYPRLAPKMQKKLAGRLSYDLEPMRQRAAALLDDLIGSTVQERVIHGDLHFENVMLTSGGPRLIDPKGLRADPAAEFRRAVVPSQRGLSTQDYINNIAKRAAVMADAIDATPQRLVQWGAAAMVQRLFRHEASTTKPHESVDHLTAFLDLAEGKTDITKLS